MPAMLTPCTLLLAVSLPAAGDDGWVTFYQGGFRAHVTGAWIGPQTWSERTLEGLRIVDASTEAGSGRLYFHAWQADPEQGAQVQARLRVSAASAPWGACINVADGVHEEDISFFPDRVMLSYADIEARFPAGDGLHTYRIELRAPDIRVWADDNLVLNGSGRFTHPVIEPDRNRIAFGASSSLATSDSVWEYVRFRGVGSQGLAPPPPPVPGLEIRRGDTMLIVPGAFYCSMFRFASGMLQVDGRRSVDGGRTWYEADGPWVGALQRADGEVIALDYRTHAADEPGWFTSALHRWDAEGRPLPARQARLHVPDFVTTIDDDGSQRDGPWCDHAIIQLRDGSLLAANSGCLAEDRTPVSSYPPEYGAMKYRGFVTRSTDGGLTWEYLATVTADPTLGSEGCNEMDLIRAPDGDLLCVFRTGGSASAPSPLYLCRSDDEGRTWGPPQQVADRGVWPNLCLTTDGVLVCTYGRPGNWLTFSLDSGHTWVGSFCFDNSPSTCYNSVEEVSPRRILVMHDGAPTYDAAGNPISGVYGTWFEVQRTTDAP